MATWTSPKTWTAGAALTAAELNEQLRDNTQYLYDRYVDRNLILSSAITTSSGSFGNATGLSFAVTDGKNYSILALLWYSHSTDTGGPAFGFDHPGGNCNMFATYGGESSNTSQDHEWENSTDTGAGVATAEVADRRYFVRIQFNYNCDTSGTWSLRWKRNTAGTAMLHAGATLIINSD